jgi:hypothetical protein
MLVFTAAGVVVGTQGADPPPRPSSARGKAGRNHLKEEITPLISTGIARRAIQPNHINLGHAALLRRW